MARAERPLSPHLQIYRWYFTMFMSVAHRVSAAVLGVGLLLLTWWLLALASGPEAFADAQAVTGSWFGGLVLFAFTYVLFHHLCSGVRHLVMDAGYGFPVAQAYLSGAIAIGAAAALTVITWIVVLAVA